MSKKISVDDFINDVDHTDKTYIMSTRLRARKYGRISPAKCTIWL